MTKNGFKLAKILQSNVQQSWLGLFNVNFEQDDAQSVKYQCGITMSLRIKKPKPIFEGFSKRQTF